MLLDEGVSVRDLARIYEALSLRAQTTKDLDQLVEVARAALGPAIVAPYLSGGAVSVISLEPLLERGMLEQLRQHELGAMLALDPDTAAQMLSDLTQLTAHAENQNLRPVLVCSPQLRPAVRRLIRPALSRLPVLSYTELIGAGQVRSVGVVTMDPVAAVSA